MTRLDFATVNCLHLELDRHDYVLAEGSYLDVGARADFGGGATPAVHSGGARGGLPTVRAGGLQVETARVRLAQRADIAQARDPQPLRLLRIFSRRSP